jgi:hypothetical protein
MLHLFGQAWKKGSHPTRPGGAAAQASNRQFDKAVDRFAKSVDKLTVTLGNGFGFQGAAYHGGPAGAGMLNAAGLSGGSDMIGSSMILARAISAGGGGGGGGGAGGGGGVAGLQYASLNVPTGGGGGGGGGGGPSHVGGGGWRSCTLTWYDPALGGTNSSNGQKNPHSRTASGEPYDANAFTCAAPSSYAFGTMIAFRIGGKQVTCRVNDRGGAISGNRFDLSRAAANAIGLLRLGKAGASFKVVGSRGSGHKGRHGGHSHLPAGSRTSKVQTASDTGGGSDPVAAALAWQSADPSSGGGGGGPGVAGAGGGTSVVVNVDGRKIDHFKQLTRGRV